MTTPKEGADEDESLVARTDLTNRIQEALTAAQDLEKEVAALRGEVEKQEAKATYWQAEAERLKGASSFSKDVSVGVMAGIRAIHEKELASLRSQVEDREKKVGVGRELLENGKELFSDLPTANDAGTPEWIWRHQVELYLEALATIRESKGGGTDRGEGAKP